MQSQPNRIVTALVLINLVQYQFLFFSHDKHTNTVRTSLFEHQILHFPNFSKDFSLFSLHFPESSAFLLLRKCMVLSFDCQWAIHHRHHCSVWRKKAKNPYFVHKNSIRQKIYRNCVRYICHQNSGTLNQWDKIRNLSAKTTP